MLLHKRRRAQQHQPTCGSNSIITGVPAPHDVPCPRLIQAAATGCITRQCSELAKRPAAQSWEDLASRSAPSALQPRLFDCQALGHYHPPARHLAPTRQHERMDVKRIGHIAHADAWQLTQTDSRCLEVGTVSAGSYRAWRRNFDTPDRYVRVSSKPKEPPAHRLDTAHLRQMQRFA